MLRCGKKRTARTVLKIKQSEELQKLHVSTRSWYNNDFMVLTSDAKGRYPLNKNHAKVTGTRPRRRPTNRWLDRLKSDMRIYGISPEIATERDRWYVMLKTLTPPRRRRRKRLVVLVNVCSLAYHITRRFTEAGS